MPRPRGLPLTQVHRNASPVASVEADLVAIPVFQGKDLEAPPTKGADAAWGRLLAELVRLGDFKGKLKEFRILPTHGALRAPRVMFLGLGKREDFTLYGAREAAARVAVAARDLRLGTAALPLLPVPGARAQDVAQAVAEGIHLGLFEFREYRSEPKDEEERRRPLEALLVLGVPSARAAAVDAGLREGTTLAEATNLARTLIMRPSIVKPPAAMAALARKEAAKAGVRVEVLTAKDLQRLGMNALLGVGVGSVHPPCLVVLEHKPRGAKRKVLLCGKGITFDSGGINLKPSDGMDRMKYDMAGSAAVLATVLAAARLRLPVHVIAIMALAENMPSGSAIRPGDVLVAYNKKTIEVANTDAEGRLVLADALSYGVKRFDPDEVVDIATLTGGVRVALGNITTGIMGSDDRLIQRLIEAGRRTGDDLWQLPLNKLYEKQVTSEIADFRNVGFASSASPIAGAAFLKQFVDGKPWAHLDIAGTCWTERSNAEQQKEYLPKGATGIGVRLFVEWLRRG
jgi:leucyl aminopeptidase